MGDRFRILKVRESGVWTAAVTVVCCGIGATFSEDGWRIGWIVIGLLAFGGGAVTLINGRLAARRKQEARK